jgi:hypothetical protein
MLATMSDATAQATNPVALARTWLEAFNAHDVPALVSLHSDDCTHTSPKIRALHPDTGGKPVGKPALTPSGGLRAAFGFSKASRGSPSGHPDRAATSGSVCSAASRSSRTSTSMRCR